MATELPGELSIMLTRPVDQSLSMQQKLNQLGARTILFPCLQIKPVEYDTTKISVSNIDTFIFISPNAVNYGFQALPELTDAQVANKPFAAIGQSTAQALLEKGVTRVITPAEQFDSEGLLETPLLQNVQNQSIMIIKGIGGRPYLMETLRQRGADVSCIDVYERKLPENPDLQVLSAHIDLILFSSSQSAENFLALLPAEQTNQLFNCQTIVGHPKIGQKVSSLGFKKLPIIAASPLEDDLIEAIKTWARRR
ncbi:MAG: uroporphyrinogen-III synthase [Pseudomonadota bacterium]